MLRLASSLKNAGLATLATVVASMPGTADAQRRDEELFIRPEDQRSVLFAGIDGGRSVFASGGWKQTLTGPLDRTGFVVSESAGFGLTPERVRIEGLGIAAMRLTTQSSVAAGHQWNRPGLFVTALAGPELQHEQLTVAGRVLRFSKPRYGIRAQAELWSNPTADTLLTGTAVASSARASLWARGSAGYRFWRDLFAGPEITTYATDTYRELRVGAHLTGWRAGIVQGRLSAGWTMTDDGRPGAPYVGASAWIRL